MMRSHSRRDFLEFGLGAVASAGLLGCGILKADEPETKTTSRPPNVILVYFDDLGYADLSCYGSKARTENMDAMAEEGMMFSRYYAPSNVCSPSRAGTLTGCYPQRVSMDRVLFPTRKKGLHTDEETIADLVKAKGYSTMCVGKWHLGHMPKNLPGEFGFDSYFGLPYSNDMWPRSNHGLIVKRKAKWPPLRIYTDDTPGEEIQSMGQQAQLTARMTRKAIGFINANKSRPFFLYLAHPMPHVPIAASPSFRGESGAGLYCDVIRELDWSVGEIRKALRKHGLAANTLLIVTSDNGPWLQYGNWGGKAGPLREGKTTTFEGGHRVPCIMEMPGTIPAGRVSPEIVGGIDILPTICAMTGAPLPKKKIDGRSILPILRGSPNAKSPHDYYYYFGNNTDIQAVAKGRWKLHLPHGYSATEGQKRGTDGIYVKGVPSAVGLELYDLENDPGERHDVSAEHPDLVEQLKSQASCFHRLLMKERRPLG